jgi:hypothetical protein
LQKRQILIYLRLSIFSPHFSIPSSEFPIFPLFFLISLPDHNISIPTNQTQENSVIFSFKQTKTRRLNVEIAVFANKIKFCSINLLRWSIGIFDRVGIRRRFDRRR